MKTVFKVRNLFVVLALAMTSLISGCTKDGSVDPDPSNPSLNFQPSDFKITILEKVAYTEYYRIEFEATNLKNEAYGDQSEDGSYYVRFKVKTTDGAEYQSQAAVNDMSARGSSTNACSIDFPSGKTVNESTLNYEIYEN